MSTDFKLVACQKCGWNHFQVSREYVEKEVSSFNEYYASLDDETKSHFGGPSSISNYERCFRCGNPYKDFRDVSSEEAERADRRGCTIQPIMDRND